MSIKNKMSKKVKKVQKQEHKVSYRCSLPSPLQKGSKDWEVLIRLIHKCEILRKIGNRASIGYFVPFYVV